MNGERKTTHRNHFVPQGYLKNFAHEKQIHVLDLENTRQSGPKHIRNVGQERDLYTLDSTDIFSRIDIAETALGKVEVEAHPLLQKLCDGDWPLTGAERATLALYLAIQMKRGPEVKARYAKFIKFLESQRSNISGIEELEEIVLSYKDIRLPYFNSAEVWSLLQNEQFSFRDDLDITNLANIFVPAQDMVGNLLGRLWAFVYFNTNSLFTSDSPVSRFIISKERAHEHLTDASAEGLMVPLSPRLALLIGNAAPPQANGSLPPWEDIADGIVDRRIDGTPGDAEDFNRMTIYSAYRYLYRHPHDAHLDPNPLPEPTRLS